MVQGTGSPKPCPTARRGRNKALPLSQSEPGRSGGGCEQCTSHSHGKDGRERRHNNGSGGVLGRAAEGSQPHGQLAQPPRQQHSLALRPLPRVWAPAALGAELPWVLFPLPWGGLRAMGYLGVGLLSLPLQEPELLLLLSEEVP